MSTDDDAASRLHADLIRRLSACNLSAISRESGVALKTLIRIRDQVNSPTLDTAAKIVRALDRKVAPRRKAAPRIEAPAAACFIERGGERRVGPLVVAPERRRLQDRRGFGKSER